MIESFFLMLNWHEWITLFFGLHQGKDVVARAKTGSGKTFAYLLPLLQKLFADSSSRNKLGPFSFVLVPTRERCHQVPMFSSFGSFTFLVLMVPNNTHQLIIFRFILN